MLPYQIACKKELVILNGVGHFPIEEEGLNILEKEITKLVSENERGV